MNRVDLRWIETKMILCFMMKVFAAVLLLLLIVSDCHSEVVKNFTETCPQFFATPNDVLSPPTIFNDSQYKQICQKLNNAFATLYDTANRIPVFSAYVFTGARDCERPKVSWYIEPQLDAGPNMKTNTQQLQNQASNADYDKSGYDKGHLVPVYHAETQACANATFPLTSSAPQDCSFNRGQWKVAERKVADVLKSECLYNHYRAYIVTGVVPGSENIKNRVNIPSYFWSAFCCLDNNNTVKNSGGYYGINQNHLVSDVTLQNLENTLTALYGRSFVVFNGGCYMPENELDMWLLFKECMDKGGDFNKFIRAKQCFGINTDKETISRCIDLYCTTKIVYPRKRLHRLNPFNPMSVTRQRYRHWSPGLKLSTELKPKKNAN